MQKIKAWLYRGMITGTLTLALGGVFSAGLMGIARADVTCPDGTSAKTQLDCGINEVKPTNAPTNLFGPGSIFTKIADLLIFIVGAVSVIMLIIGGLRYVLSSGNASAVEGAKNTILYAIIGIIVALLAFAAVAFVSKQIQ